DPELLLLDLNMPGAQGFDILTQARAHHPAVPVIIISAREDPTIVQRALAHGAAAFVPKSSPIEQIVDALRTVLRGDTWLPPGMEDADTAHAISLDEQEAQVAS